MKSLAWKSGFNAFKAGIARAACPFGAGSAHRKQWLAGFAYAAANRLGMNPR